MIEPLHDAPSSALHLGLNLGHDRAAALVRDGRLLAALEEERLDRNKHGPGLPKSGRRQHRERSQRKSEDWRTKAGSVSFAVPIVRRTR